MGIGEHAHADGEVPDRRVRAAVVRPPWATATTAPADQLRLCGVPLTDYDLGDYLIRLWVQLTAERRTALAVGSVNLDHLHHFARRRHGPRSDGAVGAHWLLLADGAPISARASAARGRTWSRLPGADLMPSTLDVAQAAEASVGFLGGTQQSTAAASEEVGRRWPGVRVAGCWVPSRSALLDDASSRALADEICRAGVDVLFVGLGKPLQEAWIDQHGRRTGAQVLAAFGGAADFLGGTTRRAPSWMRRRGLEWLFRLVCEPRRLGRRYVVQGPRSLVRLLVSRPELRELR